MLKSLHIKNLAIIDELTVNFESGLNLITGETGAGKSILVNALNYLLGDRFSKDSIRTGAESTIVEGEFSNGKNTEVIRRIYYANGKSRSFLNDVPITVEKLIKKTEFLIDIHGQHDHQRLLKVANHLEYLDVFGDYQKDLKKIAELYADIIKLKKEIDQQKKRLQKLAELKELYQFQLAELTEIDLTEDLDLLLANEYKILSNAEEYHNTISDLIILLDDSPGSLKENISRGIHKISGLPGTDQALQTIANRFESLQLEADDIMSDLAHIKRGIVLDDEKLSQLSDQLQHVEKLKRKYGGNLKKVIAYRDDIQYQLTQSEINVDNLKKYEKELKEFTKNYFNLSVKLTQKRKECSVRLEKKILSILSEMNMQNTQLKIVLGEIGHQEMLPTGRDTCEFYISANIGENIRPLAKIASGGEISRFMLAIKLVLHNRDTVDTLIFDEIDSGISGRTALQIGEILEELGQYKQVLCITHLPQIASKGKSHFKIFKEQRGKRTLSKIKKLTNNERIAEIASLISGDTVTSSGLEQAAQLLGGKPLING